MRVKPFAVGLIILGSYGCHPAAKAPTPGPVAVGAPDQPFQSPSGKTYQRTRVGPSDDDEPVVIPPIPAGAAPNLDTFRGTARKAAKLSIASSAVPKTFNGIASLLDSLIPDEQMRAKRISSASTSGRLPEEQVLVTVDAYLYAASRESDNDFHCIFGQEPGRSDRFMNVEVSALPASSSPFFLKLRSARNQFKTFFTAQQDALPASGYEKYSPPIPVRVTGSLFFDVDHVPPAVGPQGLKPLTAWEIHPVSNLEFEPSSISPD